MFAIYKRELKSYCTGMIAPIFSALLLVLVGIFTTATNLMGGYPNFEYALASVLIIYLIIMPLLSMRSFAEDLHTRTDQLLFSLPMKLSAVVFAKYMAMVTVLGVNCVIMCFYPLILSLYGTVNFAVTFSAILAFFLLGCALIAIGMFLSSLTESQVIAAVLSLGVFILLYLMGSLITLIPVTATASLIGCYLLAGAAALILYYMTKNSMAALGLAVATVFCITAAYMIRSSLFVGLIQKILSTTAIFDRFTNFTNGVVDITALVYYISVSALFVFFTVQSMEKKRWL
jgi:ABC-2 type transport system permease protein